MNASLLDRESRSYAWIANGTLEHGKIHLVPRHDETGPAVLLRDGLDLVRKGRAMIRAAENMGAVAHVGPVADNAHLVDFSALPGRSPEAHAEALYVGRRLRDSLFPDNLFSEPAWDILLSVFLAQREGHADTHKVLLECNVPRRTGMRYVAQLIDYGLLVSRSGDDEPTRVALSTTGMRTMRRFFEITESGVPVRTASIERRQTSSAD